MFYSKKQYLLFNKIILQYYKKIIFVIYYKYNLELRNLLNVMIKIRVIYMLKLFHKTEMFVMVMFLINLSPIILSAICRKKTTAVLCNN